MDYEYPPCQTIPAEPDDAPVWDAAELPTGAERPRRRRRSRPVLIIFLAVILAGLIAAAVLRFCVPAVLDFTWDDLLPFTGEFYFGSDLPGAFDDRFEDQFELPTTTQSTLTTIPRADPDPAVQLTLTDAPGQELSFQEIYEKVLPSIVSIQAAGRTSGSEGTGVIMTPDGYVITNHHVISGCHTASVTLHDGTIYDASLVGSDAESDLAVLKIDAQGLTCAEFGNSDQLRVGDVALAIGNPLGSELFGTLTEGIISAINRDVNVEGYEMSLIQTTAALNPGNSGGALINSAGQVVGITNMKMMSDYETIEGLGFAIPSTWTKEVVDTLLAHGAITGRPTIGFTCYTMFLDDPALYGQTSGVCIESVTPHGPAEQAGVRSGDIILKANGQTVPDLETLTLIRDEVGVGGTMTLTVSRGEEILELTLTLVDQYELN